MSSVASVHADNRLSNKGHWDRTGAVAHVKFLDHTDSPWPVDTASADWDEANQIDVDWQLTDGSSQCRAGCVRVRTRAPDEDLFFGPNCTGAAGYWTNGPPDANNHWDPDNEVRFNRSCNGERERVKRALACQELGHALGLAHADTQQSCMWEKASEADTTPGPHQLLYA